MSTLVQLYVQMIEVSRVEFSFESSLRSDELITSTNYENPTTHSWTFTQGGVEYFYISTESKNMKLFKRLHHLFC